MSKTTRARGNVERTVKNSKKRRKRPCRSAPSTPANVTLNFRRRERKGGRREWVGRTKFDEVTTDVAGRAQEVEKYVIQLRAVDPSGDPVETQGQAQEARAHGSDFTVHAGSAPATGRSRELDAGADVVKFTLTGLTAGIEAQVQFLARKSSASAATAQVSIFNVTDTATVGATKNGSPGSQKNSQVIAEKSFTPVSGKTYEARVTHQSGAAFKFDGIKWHDKGDAAVWKEEMFADDDPNVAVFPISHPRSWFYQTRVRALNRIHGGKCWSAWSAWTTPALPADEDAELGPPEVTNLTLTFDKVESARHRVFQALGTWDETPPYVQPDGDPQEGAHHYDWKLDVSENGGGATARTRRGKVQSEANTGTINKEFRNIRKRRSYRLHVRPVDKDGNPGAWTTTGWVQPSSTVANPLNVVQTKPRPRVIVAKWDPPSGDDKDDVDRYRVRVYQGAGGANLRETAYTRSHHFRYHVPIADKGTAHRIRVTAVDQDDNMSSEVDEGTDATDDGADATVDPGTIAKYSGSTVPTGWLKADGTLYSTTSFADLFGVVGYTYGGSGASFAVPDFRKRKPMGVGTGDALGENEGIAEGSRSEVQLHGAHDGHGGGGHNSPGGHGVHAREDQNTDGTDHNHPSDINGGTINITTSGVNYAANNSPTTGAQPRGDHGHPNTAFQGSVGSRSANHVHGHDSTHDNSAGVTGHGGHTSPGTHTTHGGNEHGDHGGKPRLRVHFMIKT